jgi:hypothetical protein
VAGSWESENFLTPIFYFRLEDRILDFGLLATDFEADETDETQ